MNKAIYAILLLLIILLGFGSYYIGVQDATELQAKKVVTALEMVVACQQVGNVTIEQIQEQYIKTFIMNRSTTE